MRLKPVEVDIYYGIYHKITNIRMRAGYNNPEGIFPTIIGAERVLKICSNDNPDDYVIKKIKFTPIKE